MPPEKTEEQEFAAAFGEFASGTPAPAAAPEGTPTPAPAPAAGTTSAPAAAPEGTPTPAPAPAAGTTPAPASPPADWQAQMDELRRQLAAAQMPTPAPAPAVQPTPAPAPAPVYTADEQAALDAYVKEWPDVARGEMLARRTEYQQLVGHIFDQLRPVLATLQETVGRHGEQLMYADLTGSIPDYDANRDAVLAWIETQPSFLKAAYQKVADEGSAEDVQALFEIWRKANPAAPVAAAPALAGTPAATPTPTPAPAPDAAALASLKTVQTGRNTANTGGADPNDFDGAFAEFAAKKD